MGHVGLWLPLGKGPNAGHVVQGIPKNPPLSFNGPKVNGSEGENPVMCQGFPSLNVQQNITVVCCDCRNQHHRLCRKFTMLLNFLGGP